MKKLVVILLSSVSVACGSGENTNNSGDSAAGTTGNSAGISTIGLDTTHMDTSASKLIPDSTR